MARGAIKSKIVKIKKRNGRIVPFSPSKIERAIKGAFRAAGNDDLGKVRRLTREVVSELEKRFNSSIIPEVEQVQDIVEKILLKAGQEEVYNAFTLYRQLHQKLRSVSSLVDADELTEKYLNQEDWRVKENANMTYSLQGLNNHVASIISANFWLNKIYSREIRKAHRQGDLHIHDLSSLSAYCTGWDLKDLLIKGFGGVIGKVHSAPPKHFSSALGQIVNFMYTVQGEVAGAVAVSNFDTYLAPFIHYDGLTYKQTKQAMQEFVFNMNVPTRVGFQTPFSNITLDVRPTKTVGEETVIIGGQPTKDKYKDFQKEMDMINRSFAELMIEGDAQGRVFTFPIPTYSITGDFDWDNKNLEPVWEMTRKYGIPYFSNFVNSDMDPDDARSMCCRLRLDNRELRKRGGLFAANPLTGSLGVVTINLPRVGYLSKVGAKSEGFAKRRFFTILGHLMDLAKESLVIKRSAVEKFTQDGLYPYCRYYLADIYRRNGVYWRNHFNTIGLNGMNEALVNLLGKTIADPEGQAFALEVMDYMRGKILLYQQETDEMFNLEATPAESAAYRFARLDKEQFPGIICANEERYQKEKEAPFYTNSTHLPVGYTDDLFEALDLQDELQCKYTGGCIEEGNKVLTDKGLMPIEEIVEKFDKLRPLRVVSYHSGREISEWDEVLEAVEIDVERKKKVRIEGERGLDIVTSDWHPFFVMKKRQVAKKCPICNQPVINAKAFAAHLRYHPDCRKKYHQLSKYQIVTKRADELKRGDYILQNDNNVLPDKGGLDNQLMWLIGFYIGDGCLSEFIDNRGGNKLKKYKLRFFSEHQEAMNKVVQVLNDNFGCTVNAIKNDKRSDRLLEVSTSRKEAVDFFLKKGFLPGSKVYSVGVPKKVKDVIGDDNVFSFLSGLMDSDGYLSKRDGNFEYYTVSPKLVDDLLAIFTLAGILISKSEKPTKRKNEKNIWRLKIPAYEMTRISDRLTNTFNSLRINNQLSRRTKRQLPVVRVKRTTKLKPKENKLFYDLMTKKNHNYLAGKDCLVFVHNTVLHGFLGESLPDTESVKNLLRKVTGNYKLPYFSITPTFSICPKHGYLPGEWQFCPKCDEEIGYQEE